MKLLLIRFSSFGDIVQCLSIPASIKEKYPSSEIHLITRSDYSEIAETHPLIFKVWSLQRKTGIFGLFGLAWRLNQEKFTHIYDAHNNIRSHLLCWFLNGPLGLFRVWKGHHFLRKSKYRWRRFLLFRFHVNLYPKPFVGQWALLEPLSRWGVSLNLPPPPQLHLPQKLILKIKEKYFTFSGQSSQNKTTIALSPSASYPLKRWPISFWQELIIKKSDWRFILLGGPEDHFIQEIADAGKISQTECYNLAGKLSYLESAAVIKHCQLLISNDTGLMHISEQLGLPCIALMGPAPFGYPGRSTTTVLERNLECRPCSKHGQGPCINAEFQLCLRDISPDEVVEKAQAILKS